MREQTLDELFAEFEAQALPTFRPPGVPDAERRLRSRPRRRRGLLAGVVALLLAGPAGAYAMAGRNPDHPPNPTVTPRVVERPISLPRGAGALVQLQFIDGRHGWALFNTCSPGGPADGCRLTLARTGNGGVIWTWSDPLPGAPDAYLLPLDGRTLTVWDGQQYRVTTDGGTTETLHPPTAPPPATQRALASRSGFLLACPSTERASYGIPRNCQDEQLRLVRIDGTPVPRQPPMPLRGDLDVRVIEGGDGRLWLTVLDEGKLTVMVSADQAVSWQALPAFDDVDQLLVSPDGRDVWLVGLDGPKPVRQLVDGRWQQRTGLPDDTKDVAAAGGGRLVVTSVHGGAGFWTDGGYTDLPELREPTRSGGASVHVLRDGTILFAEGGAHIIATGTPGVWARIS
ncbi:hypothetical protein ABZ754_00050 [Micromonospora purpureochromogenes]|uniref:hypothetical protein n=1 Tax=Micromonospora purpureochromogenes TaxID=47872 RepID=UPI0033F8F510